MRAGRGLEAVLQAGDRVTAGDVQALERGDQPIRQFRDILSFQSIQVFVLFPGSTDHLGERNSLHDCILDGYRQPFGNGKEQSLTE